MRRGRGDESAAGSLRRFVYSLRYDGLVPISAKLPYFTVMAGLIPATQVGKRAKSLLEANEALVRRG
jgi:hypothetical protein